MPFLQSLPYLKSLSRICCKCKELLPMEAFAKNRTDTDGYQRQCRDCGHEYYLANYRTPEMKRRAKGYKLARKYGMTVEDKDNMLAAQGGRCAACGSLEHNHTNGWNVDHDHMTNKVRAILCGPCNLSLGHAKESSSRLRAVADYIDRFGKDK